MRGKRDGEWDGMQQRFLTRCFPGMFWFVISDVTPRLVPAVIHIITRTGLFGSTCGFKAQILLCCKICDKILGNILHHSATNKINQQIMDLLLQHGIIKQMYVGMREKHTFT